jgi:hypothetical protein
MPKPVRNRGLQCRPTRQLVGVVRTDCLDSDTLSVAWMNDARRRSRHVRGAMKPMAMFFAMASRRPGLSVAVAVVAAVMGWPGPRPFRSLPRPGLRRSIWGSSITSSELLETSASGRNYSSSSHPRPTALFEQRQRNQRRGARQSDPLRAPVALTQSLCAPEEVARWRSSPAPSRLWPSLRVPGGHERPPLEPRRLTKWSGDRQRRLRANLRRFAAYVQRPGAGVAGCIRGRDCASPHVCQHRVRRSRLHRDRRRRRA